ncbi:MAG TPA: zinc ABC transporter substrate-binding protein [Syntrophales bacterium]|nr:zinc ABC transporter substrate-binding protein [Syntrophales bacterium]
MIGSHLRIFASSHLRLAATTAVFLLTAAFAAIPSDVSARLEIMVSVPPQAFIVEKIGGERVNVRVMIPGHLDHDAYEPTPRQLVSLSRADIYFKLGTPHFPFETRYIDPAAGRLKRLLIVNMSEGIGLLGEDPHFWMSPLPVRQAAANVARSLSGRDPAGRSVYEKNLNRFLQEVDDLDRLLLGMMKGMEGGTFIIFHPALGYFASRYGLSQVAIETEGKPPSAAHLRNVIRLAKEKRIRTILIQKGFDRKNAAAVAGEIGAKLAEIDALDRDWTRGMMRTAESVRKALGR